MVPFIGLASGIGGGDSRSAEGPPFLKQHLLIEADWKAMILPQRRTNDPLATIASLNRQLAEAAFNLVKEERFFISLGGDHSSGIGVWSGVASALKAKGDIGLMWIDAHMDSHTPQTSESGNIHGMPLAVLLGHGEDSLTTIADPLPKIKPENLVLIGIRSFESGEAELLKSLNVRVYFMEEVKERGLSIVMKEALEIVSRNTVGFGISLDLDAIDPQFAPSVGTPVPDGIHPEEMLSALSLLREYPPLAFEFVEYIPSLDPQLRTLPFIQQLMTTVTHICLPVNLIAQEKSSMYNPPSTGVLYGDY